MLREELVDALHDVAMRLVANHGGGNYGDRDAVSGNEVSGGNS